MSRPEIVQVPFQDFGAATDELREELDDAYRRFMDSGWYVLGGEVTAFESEYAEFCDAPYCVGVGNGLDALHLAVRALGIGAGDEVIVASNTYIATWLGVTHASAIPVPVEPDIATYNLNPALVELAITSRTKAILATNLYGQPCDYDQLLDVARRNRLKLIVDNAQAQGARYKGRRVGSIADVECHSFYPSKNLGAYGEAGAVTTSDAELAESIRTLRNYGSKVRYYNEVIGYNSRLDELQAAFLRVKLKHLDSWNARRAKTAESYHAALSPHADTKLTLPSVPEWAVPVWHLFVIRHPQRDALREHLQKAGIQTLIHYPVPPHLSSAYATQTGDGINRRPMPVAEMLATQVLSLPIGPHTTEKEVGLVADAVANFQKLP